ncbi:MAG: RNase adapter RapZ [Piscirickettsiaceae bacterium]|nr:MAG: RNase adapter RapZ [Piscirickettsiaceae bacterium]
MKLIIVSGLSGSGKSVTLDTLEDCGFYCTDNLPVDLLQSFANLLEKSEQPIFNRVAVGIDARNDTASLRRFDDFMQQLQEAGIAYEVIFLRADKNSLLKRFSETRRKHPLSDSETSLDEAIELEIEQLSPIANHASLQIDTTHTNVHQLRELVIERIGNKNAHSLSLQIISFGYKHGVPNDVDFVFDARCLPNPYWEPTLRKYTGKDSAVIDFLSHNELVQQYLNDTSNYLKNWIPRFSESNRNYLSIAIGCTGGQHRSVFLTEQLSKRLQEQGLNVIARHRELS